MNFSDDQRKHMEMMQVVISRMAGNSFLIRGWTVTLISALFALAAKDANRHFVLISYFPCVVFWCLDAYYLGLERQFRSLYSAVAANPTQTTVPPYSMDISLAAKSSDSWSAAFFSISILLFHVPLIAIISLVMWLLPKV